MRYSPHSLLYRPYLETLPKSKEEYFNISMTWSNFIEKTVLVHACFER
jgi:hypothetical protein